MRKTRDCLFCLENGIEHLGKTPAPSLLPQGDPLWSGFGCRAYAAQIAWNKRTARLLASEPSFDVPPAPDYSTPMAVTERARERGSLDGLGRNIYALLDGDGRQYRLFAAAVARAQRPALRRAA